MSRTVIVAGSARQDGNTMDLVNFLESNTDWDAIDLNDYKIGYYDYNHSNRDDDYLNLIRRIVDQYDTIAFVTPVYWYAMSGIMKVFFDRLSDLLSIEKDLGRKFRGKNMAVFTTSEGDNLGDYFWLPFSETARYMGMNFLGGVHTQPKFTDQDHIKKLIKAIESMG